MTIRTSVFSLAIATCGLFAATSSAQAFQIVNRPNLTDDDFRALMATGKFTEKFVAESRIGLTGNGEHETGLIKVDTKPDFTQTATTIKTGQQDWQKAEKKGQEVRFTMAYDGIGTVTYTVGGQVLQSDLKTGPITDLFIRTRAHQGSTMLLKSLMLTNAGATKSWDELKSEGKNQASGDVDYIQVEGLKGAFTLSGISVMDWATAQAPTRSRLAYQIKAGTTPPKDIPEPTALGALAIAGIAIYRSKRQSATRSIES